ncbi:MAG: glycosyltransferase family 4 protein [Lyngbya sp.]|nr:glycosyltransferase family 4 protein [Lyngbya sp.]
MKILMQHRHSEQEISGVSTYIQALSPVLQNKGHEVRVVSTKEDDLQKWIKAIQWSDIVHMNSNHLLFATLSKLLGKKAIIKYHYPFYQSTHFEYTKTDFPRRLKQEIIHLLQKKNYPLKWKLYTAVKFSRLITRLSTAFLSDRHIACSQFLAESYSFPLKIDTVYNPIVIDRESVVLKTRDDLHQPLLFVFVGRLQNDKGVDVLLKAVKILKSESREFKVWIIGDGSERNNLEKLASDLEISDSVKFLGKRPNSEVKSIMGLALAVVAPSRWQEPAAYIVVEASSMQTCSIVSQVGGLPELVGTHGFLFNNEDVVGLADWMKYCLDHPEEALQKGWQAYQYAAENFSPSLIADQFLQICTELTNLSTETV